MFLIISLLWRVYADVSGRKKVCVCGLGITKNTFAPEFGKPVTTSTSLFIIYFQLLLSFINVAINADDLDHTLHGWFKKMYFIPSGICSVDIHNTLTSCYIPALTLVQSFIRIFKVHIQPKVNSRLAAFDAEGYQWLAEVDLKRMKASIKSTQLPGILSFCPKML